MNNFTWDETQQDAIDRALLGQDIVITGGAGTGKTTLIGEIADRLGKCLIYAPTGKAAARLKQATGHYACTLHRGLGWDGERFWGGDDMDCPVIVDESSMLDSWLLASLIERKPRQLILVGDAGQLPPVGRGQPFHDLVEHKPGIVCTLATCYRNQSAVHKAANSIRQGHQPEKREKTGGESWALMNTGGGATTEARIAEWTRAGAIDPAQDIVVAARYGADAEDQGNIHSLNATMLEILNPHEAGEEWRQGDRVLCCKNFSKIDLWNGDIGTVQSVDIDGNVWVTLDREREEGQGVLCEKEHRRELKLAYCLSVHKAQGSQFRRVVVVVLRKHVRMLDRALLYTAVTRAREGCVVCGELGAFYAGIERVKDRQTVLQQLLKGRE